MGTEDRSNIFVYFSQDLGKSDFCRSVFCSQNDQRFWQPFLKLCTPQKKHYYIIYLTRKVDALLAHTSLNTQNVLQRQSMEKDIYTFSIRFLRFVVIHLRNRHELWFQQDGVTCYTANEAMDVQQVILGNNIISAICSHLATKITLPKCSRLLSLGIITIYLKSFINHYERPCIKT